MGVRSNDAAELYLPFEEVAQPTKGAAQKAGDRPGQWAGPDRGARVPHQR